MGASGAAWAGVEPSVLWDSPSLPPVPFTKIKARAPKLTPPLFTRGWLCHAHLAWDCPGKVSVEEAWRF